MSSHDALAAAVQDHWAPLLRRLAAYSRRFDLAEDALAHAVERAVDVWAVELPDNPAGWLYQTAKRNLVDELRKEQTARRHRHLIARAEVSDGGVDGGSAGGEAGWARASEGGGHGAGDYGGWGDGAIGAGGSAGSGWGDGRIGSARSGVNDGATGSAGSSTGASRRVDDAADLPGSVVTASRTVDDRIELLWLACHPALAADVRPILALRFVLGLSTQRIASLFLVSSATLAARLTRAKKRVAVAGLSLGASHADPERANDVAHSLYLAYTAAYYSPDLDASADVVRLIHRSAAAVPHPALVALDVLATLSHARRFARHPRADLGGGASARRTSGAGTSGAGASGSDVSAAGENGREARGANVSAADVSGVTQTFVTLAEQDRTLWRDDEIVAALRTYANLDPTTGFAEELRIMATIAAFHSVAPSHELTDWRAIDAAYAKLEALTASPVATLNRQAARALSGSHIDAAAVNRLQRELPHHHRVSLLASRLHLQVGDTPAARAALRTAIDQCESEHERETLRTQLAALE